MNLMFPTNGRLEVFFRASNGNLGHTYQVAPNGPWADPWEDLGFPIDGTPTAFLNSDGCLQVFAIGPDNFVGYTVQTAPAQGPWSDWTSLGGNGLATDRPGESFISDVHVFGNSDGRLEVFALSLESAFGFRPYHSWQNSAGDNTTWSDWQGFPGDLLCVPGSAFLQNDDGGLVAITSDARQGNQIWVTVQNSAPAWSQQVELQYIGTGLAAFDYNGIEVFGVGEGNILGHFFQAAAGDNANWNGWNALPNNPPITNPPAVFLNQPPTGTPYREILFGGEGGQLCHIWATPDEAPVNGQWWSGWGNVCNNNPTIKWAPSVFRNADMTLEVFAVDTDGNLGHTRQSGPAAGPWTDWELLANATGCLSGPAAFRNVVRT